MPGFRPVRLTECAVTGDEFRLESDPYAVVAPYSTCEPEGWSVVHVTVAEVAVMLLTVTALITGTDSGVENVKFPDADVPPESVEIAA